MAGMLDLKMNMRSAIPSYMKVQAVISREKMFDSDRIFYDDGSTLVTDTELFGRLRYGMAMGRSGKLELDAGAGRLSSRFFDGLVVNDTERDRSTYVLGQVRGVYEYNTLNDQNYATNGMMIHASAFGVYGNYSFFPENDRSRKQEDKGVNWFQFAFNYERYWSLNRSLSIGVEGNVEISTRKLLDNYAATMVMLPVFHPTASTYNSFNASLRAPQYLSLGLKPVWKITNMFQLRGEFHGFMPWRKVLPDITPDDSRTTMVKAKYGDWFADPVFFGELAAVYALPFAHLTAYVNYCNTPGTKWNIGLSFGLFFLAPEFLH